MTFDAEWITQLDSPGLRLRMALNESLSKYDEYCFGYDYYDGIIILEIISDRDVETVKDIVSEGLQSNFHSLCDSDFDIEIDLDVPYF